MEPSYFEPDLLKRVRERCASLGVPVEEYVRRLVEAGLRTDPSTIFNLGSSGGSDIAQDKEDMLGEAFETR